MASTDHIPPLPSGWECRPLTNGRVVFWNEATATTSYVHPVTRLQYSSAPARPAPIHQPSTAPSAKNPEPRSAGPAAGPPFPMLPNGWSYLEEGEYYVFYDSTGQSKQLEHPFTGRQYVVVPNAEAGGRNADPGTRSTKQSHGTSDAKGARPHSQPTQGARSQSTQLRGPEKSGSRGNLRNAAQAMPPGAKTMAASSAKQTARPASQSSGRLQGPPRGKPPGQMRSATDDTRDTSEPSLAPSSGHTFAQPPQGSGSPHAKAPSKHTSTSTSGQQAAGRRPSSSRPEVLPSQQRPSGQAMPRRQPSWSSAQRSKTVEADRPTTVPAGSSSKFPSRLRHLPQDEWLELLEGGRPRTRGTTAVAGSAPAVPRVSKRASIQTDIVVMEEEAAERPIERPSSDTLLISDFHTPDHRRASTGNIPRSRDCSPSPHFQIPQQPSDALASTPPTSHLEKQHPYLRLQQEMEQLRLSSPSLAAQSATASQTSGTTLRDTEQPVYAHHDPTRSPSVSPEDASDTPSPPRPSVTPPPLARQPPQSPTPPAPLSPPTPAVPLFSSSQVTPQQGSTSAKPRMPGPGETTHTPAQMSQPSSVPRPPELHQQQRLEDDLSTSHPQPEEPPHYSSPLPRNRGTQQTQQMQHGRNLMPRQATADDVTAPQNAYDGAMPPYKTKFNSVPNLHVRVDSGEDASSTPFAVPMGPDSSRSATESPWGPSPGNGAASIWRQFLPKTGDSPMPQQPMARRPMERDITVTSPSGARVYSNSTTTQQGPSNVSPKHQVPSPGHSKTPPRSPSSALYGPTQYTPPSRISAPIDESHARYPSAGPQSRPRESPYGGAGATVDGSPQMKIRTPPPAYDVQATSPIYGPLDGSTYDATVPSFRPLSANPSSPANRPSPVSPLYGSPSVKPSAPTPSNASPPRLPSASPPRVASASPPRVASASPPRLASASPPRVVPASPPRVASASPPPYGSSYYGGRPSSATPPAVYDSSPPPAAENWPPEGRHLTIDEEVWAYANPNSTWEQAASGEEYGYPQQEETYDESGGNDVSQEAGGASMWDQYLGYCPPPPPKPAPSSPPHSQSPVWGPQQPYPVPGPGPHAAAPRSPPRAAPLSYPAPGPASPERSLAAAIPSAPIDMPPGNSLPIGSPPVPPSNTAPTSGAAQGPYVDPAPHLCDGVDLGPPVPRPHPKTGIPMTTQLPAHITGRLVSPPQGEPVTLFQYDFPSASWKRSTTLVRIDGYPFQEGALRYVYFMKDLNLPPGPAQDFAVKWSKNAIEPKEEYFLEGRMQATAQWYAGQFNRCRPPRRIRYLTAKVMECPERLSPAGTPAVFLVEQFIRGQFIKYTNNFGWVNPQYPDAAIPQAFSHFTFNFSDAQLIVVDVQGFKPEDGSDEEVYTDPQINTIQAEKPFGKADMKQRGIDKFFQSHTCNKVCQIWDEWLQANGETAEIAARNQGVVSLRGDALPGTLPSHAPNVTPVAPTAQPASASTDGFTYVSGITPQMARSQASPAPTYSGAPSASMTSFGGSSPAPSSQPPPTPPLSLPPYSASPTPLRSSIRDPDSARASQQSSYQTMPPQFSPSWSSPPLSNAPISSANSLQSLPTTVGPAFSTPSYTSTHQSLYYG